MTPDEEIQRGREAEILMSNTLLSAAFSEMEAAILDQMRAVDIGNTQRHRDLIVSLQLLSSIKRHLRTHIETGNMAFMQKESLAARIFRKRA